MTMDSLISGLQNQNLKIPSEHHSDVQRLSMTGSSAATTNRDDVPFERYVDIWWLALCLGLQEGRRTNLAPDQWHTFVRAGEVLPSNPWRIFQLQLMFIGETGSTDILSRPGELIAMANEFAATGLPLLIDEATGTHVPIWAVTTFVEERITQ